jgi:myo-inositol 2-dehydrogenase/D-chiro-inositol 1-dehydrogenase
VSKVRVGVIGTGAMGTSHVRTLARWVSQAQVVTAYDADVARVKQVCQEVGARTADGPEAVIGADDVDAVLIAAPDPLHQDLVMSCLSAGKPVLCEKPLATSAAGSQEIVDAEVALGRRLVQVGFMRRYDPAYVALRSAVLDGDLGAVRVVHCVHRNAEAHPSATSEGIVTNSMIHELDTVPWLLDDTWSAVTMTLPKVADGALRDPQIGVLETAGGVVVTSEVFVNAGYGYDVQCEVVGDAGTARLTPPYGLGFRRGGSDGFPVAADFIVRFEDAYRFELAAWVESVAAGSTTGASAWDAHRADLAAEAARRSLASGVRETITTPDPPDLYRPKA